MSGGLFPSTTRIESCDAVIRVFDDAGNVIETDDQMQMRCYERCARMYTECLENAGIPPFEGYPPKIGAHPTPAH
jgi:hypothetical protein